MMQKRAARDGHLDPSELGAEKKIGIFKLTHPEILIKGSEHFKDSALHHKTNAMHPPPAADAPHPLDKIRGVVGKRVIERPFAQGWRDNLRARFRGTLD